MNDAHDILSKKFKQKTNQVLKMVKLTQELYIVSTLRLSNKTKFMVYI